MSRPHRRDRHILAYADGFEHGSHTVTTAGAIADDLRQLAETHHLPDVVGCYALFSGHGGAVASDLCARNFVPTLLEHDAFANEPLDALNNAVAAMEAFVTSKSVIDRLYYGTTLLFVLLRGGRLYTANVGDCRAVLATRSGDVRMSQDHTVRSKEEVARINAAGGFIADGKLNGLLSYTRALGDLHFKSRKHIFFPNQPMPNEDPIVSPNPHLAEMDVPSDAQFVILGTAEVWKRLSDSATCAIVRAALAKNEAPRQCARRVVQAAVKAGARGNVAVLIVSLGDFEKSPTDGSGSLKTRNNQGASGGLSSTSSTADPSSPRHLVTTRPSTTLSAPTSPSRRRTTPFSPRHIDTESSTSTSSALLARTAVPVSIASPRTPFSTPPPLKRTSGEERNILVETPPSPTTPPVKLEPSLASSPQPHSPANAALYTPIGRGRRTRVLVPIAMWGVAPGGSEPLEDLEIHKMDLRQRSATRKMRSVSNRNGEQAAVGEPGFDARQRSGARKMRARTPTSAIVQTVVAPNPTLGPTGDTSMVGRSADSTPTTPLRTASRQDSFGVPSSLYGTSRSAQLEDVGGGGARVSHVTASSKAGGASSSTGIVDDNGLASVGGDFGRGGPAKVRYREHDLFGFIRRRGRAASRYG